MGVELLTTIVDIIFDLFVFLFELGALLLEITLWLFGILFMLLEPVLDALVSLVSGGLSWVGRRRLLDVHMPGDEPLNLEHSTRYDSSTSTFMRKMMESARSLQEDGFLQQSMSAFRHIQAGLKRNAAENRRYCLSGQEAERDGCRATHLRPIRGEDLQALIYGQQEEELPRAQRIPYHLQQPHRQLLGLEPPPVTRRRIGGHNHTLLKERLVGTLSHVWATAKRVYEHHRRFHVKDVEKHLATLRNVTGLHSMQHAWRAAGKLLEPHTKYRSPEDVFMALSTENTTLHRLFKPYDTGQAERQFWSDSEASGSNPYSSKSQRTNRAGRRLLAQEFATVAGTDCFTSNPRNPLCMPDIPQNLTLCPQNLTSTNITGNETCVEAGYINTTCIWCPARFFNGFHAIQYLISANPFVKLFFFSFTAVFPWLSWLLFIIDPDAILSGRGIICVIFHFYDILLIPATFYLGWVFVLPLLQALWRCIRSVLKARRSDKIDALLQSYESNDTTEYDREFERFRFDSEMNPNKARTGDPYAQPRQTYSLGVPPGGIPIVSGESEELQGIQAQLGDLNPQRGSTRLAESYKQVETGSGAARERSLQALQRWRGNRLQYYGEHLSAVYGSPASVLAAAGGQHMRLSEEEHIDLHGSSIDVISSVTLGAWQARLRRQHAQFGQAGPSWWW